MVEGTPATLESMYDMQFKVNGNPPATTAMYIQASTANIGIGLTNPLARLQIAGAGNDSSAAALNVTNASSTSMLYVRNDGNVGIGTTNPAYPLEINSASSLAMFRMESTNTLPANGHFSITGYTAGGFAPVYEGASFSSSYPNLAFLATGNNDTGSKEFIELSTEATVVNRPILAVRNGNFSGPVLFQINAMVSLKRTAVCHSWSKKVSKPRRLAQPVKLSDADK